MYEIDDLMLYLNGRIDGLLKKDESYVIDEIKSTRQNIFF